MAKTMSEQDTAKYQIIGNEGERTPDLWMEFGNKQLGAGTQFSIYTIGNTEIALGTKSRGIDRPPAIHFRLEGGQAPDQIAGADWLVKKISEMRKRLGIEEPGTQELPGRTIYSSQRYVETQTDLTERG